jgi:predicted RNA-binding Zn ribbon-like protein
MTDLQPARADLETTLDFINTHELERGHPGDQFRTTRAALDWLDQHVGIDPSGVPESAAVLGRIVRTRTAFRDLWDAVVEERPADDAAIRELNRVLRHRSLLEVQANRGDGGATAYQLAQRAAGDPVDGALARLAEPLALALGSADAISRLRTCADDECRYVFFDASRTHRRRWCDMASCGNRAKAARHRARARGADQPAAVSPRARRG